MTRKCPKRVPVASGERAPEALVPPALTAALASAQSAPTCRAHLPDPARPPLGYVPGQGFEKLFPFVHLPELRPAHDGDWLRFGSPELPPNLLYYGDNLQVLRTLPDESVDLIYIDPPFFSGRNYNMIWGDANEVRTFTDVWDGGLDAYLIWLNARLWEMRRVLRSTGSIFVHCDWHAGHYIKAQMDRIFGYDRLANEIVWAYRSGGGSKRRYGRKHDVLFWYTRSDDYYFDHQAVRVPYDAVIAKSRRHMFHADGKVAGDVWDLARPPNHSGEWIGYPAQKPESLLSRIIRAHSEKGAVVADFFVGGGTTPAVAQKLGRRWIACDISRIAVTVTMDRLAEVCAEQIAVKSADAGAHKVADIRVVYVGVYPVDRFKTMTQADFDRFVLQAFDARPERTDGRITGWRGPSEPVLVGPADPDAAPGREAAKAFFDACLRHLTPDRRITARVLAWKFSPELIAYRKTALAHIQKNLAPRGLTMDFDYVPIDSPQFRERIVEKYPGIESNKSPMRFARLPIIGDIVVRRLGALRYDFEAVNARSTNPDGYLVNCQWDFNHRDGHFAADPQFALRRRGLKPGQAGHTGRRFDAVLSVEHTFAKPGDWRVACRVQDNLGAEAIKAIELTVK